MSTISLDAVGKSFGTTEIIRNVSFEIEQGEFVVLVGPSGCGKSTLLRLVAGLEAVSRGRIRIGGRDVTDLAPHDRGLSMVFQSYALYPHMTVRQNIAFALHTEKLPQAEIDARVTEAARALQLDAYLDRKPKALSGGQRQRVAIGRAIVRKPQGFLFDEPLSNLDAALRAETRLEIAALHRQLGATMLYVTHDQVEAMTLADRIVVLRDGEVMQIGSPRDLYTAPANLFVAQFIGSPKMNVLPCDMHGGSPINLPGGGTISVPKGVSGQAVHLGLRPEDIRLVEPGGGQISGRIDFNEYLGADNSVFVDAGPLGRINVRVPGGQFPRPGDTVGIEVAPEHLHLFDVEGVALRKGAVV
ncbi:ABC transporter ATP-binding protein (plasmid) [Limimaricola variabilis]|uniref:ABC transporter ATP-binding protein n=1 Tax=Limimaricola variabilis TaxID=1492771 RepID=UPI002AC9A51D|nr:ABC transporter ATP-binding protein [Limimaricola variabilis]WPY96432.1 ABC transporter ATP-binding protein [Limimaricola variabilis]